MKVLSNDYGVSKFRIVANQVHSLEEGKFMFKKLVTLTDKFLDVALELCACIPIDINIRKAIRQRTCVVDAFPQAPAARAFKSFARRVLNWPIPDIPGGYLEFFVENLIRPGDVDGSESSDSGFGSRFDAPPQPIGKILGMDTSALSHAQIDDIQREIEASRKLIDERFSE